MNQPQDDRPTRHTPEQEARILEMVTPWLDTVEKEYGLWGLDCVGQLCFGRIEEIARDTTRT